VGEVGLASMLAGGVLLLVRRRFTRRRAGS
jgi:hypothetical protein